MGSTSVWRPVGRRRRSARRSIRVGAVLAAAVGLALVAAILSWSGVTLAGDKLALARLEVQPFGGSLVSARVLEPDGTRIPLSLSGDRLLPRSLLSPGEPVTVVVVVRRPSWLAWALGQTRTERLTLQTPVARLRQRWLTRSSQGALRIRFSEPVAKVSYRTGPLTKIVSGGGRSVVPLAVEAASGTTEVASAARRWERLGAPAAVTWFPVSPLPVVLASPTVARPISPRDPIRLTFSRPLKELLGVGRPRFVSSVPGNWRTANSHTLVFTPTGFGFPLAASLRLELPREFNVSSGTPTLRATRAVDWKVAGARFLRLQQLLAAAGYLPLSWQPRGTAVPRQLLAEINASVTPPAGAFSWRYPNTPPELRRLWIPEQPNQITRGAVMFFEQSHGLAVDGIAGAKVWHKLLEDTIAGTRRSDGYSYVYVHRNLPQLLTLWHNGSTVLTSPGNTGVPSAPTQLGTFPVFEHIPVGTMSGTNPDGSHYHDPGIRWISYFHGGDALHAFNRASFGTPQSLGCVELPLTTAAKVWPYTPIGTLVTIEN